MSLSPTSLEKPSEVPETNTGEQIPGIEKTATDFLCIVANLYLW